jgi:hypothetical protein
MLKVKVIAKVYDTKTMEYVQRTVEFPVSKELAILLRSEMNGKQTSPLHPHGHGDKKDKLENIRSVLRDQSRFVLEPQLLIVDGDKDDYVIGGFTNM